MRSKILKKKTEKCPEGWHDGYSIGDPSQNNGLESTNRYLKEDELENNRHGFTQF